MAWQDLAAKLQHDRPSFKPFGLADASGVQEYDGHNEYLGMVNIRAHNKWAKPILKTPSPITEKQAASGEWTKMAAGELTGLLDLPRTTQTLESPNDMTALVLRDSMGDGLSSYIQASFKRVIQTQHHANNGLSKVDLMRLTETNKPDVVIFILTERYLAFPLKTDLP